MDPLLPCPNCGSPVRADAARCDVCGARTIEERPPEWRVRAVVGVFGALFLLAAIWGIGWVKGQWSGSPAAGRTTSSHSSSGSSSSSGGSSASSSSSSSTSAPEPSNTVALPSGARLCDGGGDLRAYAGSPATSCAFAITVRDAYVGSGGLGDGTSRQVRAHSTVTDKTYMISCAGTAPVTCQGGNDAVIYLVP
jgi:hypothetical protein